jgi:hypothetical protein
MLCSISCGRDETSLHYLKIGAITDEKSPAF